MIATRLDPESIICPLFSLLFDPEYWPKSGSFSNSEAGSGYSPKFVANSMLKVEHEKLVTYNY